MLTRDQADWKTLGAMQERYLWFARCAASAWGHARWAHGIALSAWSTAHGMAHGCTPWAWSLTRLVGSMWVPCHIYVYSKLAMRMVWHGMLVSACWAVHMQQLPRSMAAHKDLVCCGWTDAHRGLVGSDGFRGCCGTWPSALADWLAGWLAI